MYPRPSLLPSCLEVTLALRIVGGREAGQFHLCPRGSLRLFPLYGNHNPSFQNRRFRICLPRTIRRFSKIFRICELNFAQSTTLHSSKDGAMFPHRFGNRYPLDLPIAVHDAHIGNIFVASDRRGDIAILAIPYGAFPFPLPYVIISTPSFLPNALTFPIPRSADALLCRRKPLCRPSE